MLAEVLGAQVRQLILTLDVVDAELALHQVLHEKITPQRDMLCTRNVGKVAGDVQRRHVTDIQWTLPKLLSKPSSNIMLEQNTASPFIDRAAPTSSASIVDCAVSSCNLTLKMIGALASVTMYDGVDLAWPH